MEYLLLIIFLLINLIALKIVCRINIKKIEAIGKNDLLDEKINKFPSNIEICKKILKKIGNESVEVEEDIDASNCLYLVASNKIIIGYLRGSFTRIQTIAHECLHSIQDKVLLMFNFIYSNIYLLTFIAFCILALLKVTQYKMFFISIFIIMGFIYYFIRSYLEMDAMTKAKFLAKEYIKEENILNEEEIKQVVNEYDKLNDKGIIATNYSLLLEVIIKTIILTILFMIL